MAANTPCSYKYQFASEPSEALKCLICLEVAEEPWQHGKCGRLFCEKCLEKYGREKPCPNCRLDQPQYLEDGKSKREIQDLAVKCSNSKSECEWEGTVRTFQEHVDTCKFTLLPCPKKCKDDNNDVKSFMKKDLDEHLEKECPNRNYTCEYCGEKGTYVEITQIHDKVCAKKIVPCPNSECTDTMQRQHVEEHVTTECEYTRTPCKYRRLGCETELKRKDMAVHEEDDKLHLHMAIDKTVELERKVKKLEVEITPKMNFTFKFVNFQERKDNNEDVSSPSYYIPHNGYRISISVYANGDNYSEYDAMGTHVSVYAHVTEGKHDVELKWPFVGKITLTLLNQLEDKNHHQRTVNLTAEVNMRPESPGRGHPKFIPYSELDYDPVKNTQYLKDDTLYFKVSVDFDMAERKPWLE